MTYVPGSDPAMSGPTEPATVTSGTPIDTNNVLVASPTGVLDYLTSQGQGYGQAVSQNVWLFVGIGIVVFVLILLAVHYR